MGMVDWVARCHELEARLAAVLEENAALEARCAALEMRVQNLESLLRQNSQNSSRPPSTDSPKCPRKRKKARSGKHPGGQPGHPGRAREFLPEERVDRREDLEPERCSNCGKPLLDEPRMDADRRQIIELPEIRALVVEYWLWRKRCPDCGGFTRGKMPPGSPKGAFGPRVQAAVALLSGKFGLSRRDAQEILAIFLDVDLCLGSVQACCEAASEAGEETVREIHATLKARPSVHVDETSFGREEGRLRWLWVIASGDAEAFLLQDGRGRAEAEALVGPGYDGILHRDRWRAYESVSTATPQLCHAHLRREFQALMETHGETGELGRALLDASNQLFHLWHRFLDGELSRADLQKELLPIQWAFFEGLERARDHPGLSKAATNLGEDLLVQWDALWTFAFHEGVEPTNNDAERALRKAVIWRKTSFGAHSEAGSRFVERILTLAGTARRRGIQILDWLTWAIQAHLEGRPAPPLVPA